MNNSAEAERDHCEGWGQRHMEEGNIWQEGAPWHSSLQFSCSQPPSQCLAKNSCLGLSPASGVVSSRRWGHGHHVSGGGSLSQKSCCHGTAYTPPCWVSSIVLCCSTELRPIHWSLELAGPAQALPRRCNKVLHLLYSNMLNISTSPHR